MSDNYLIVLTIGPVQSYISQARRTHDLFQGSSILSYLTAAGVSHAQGAENADVIYPIISPNATDNIPNRIVVRVSDNETSAKAIAADMEKATRKRWKQLSNDVRNKLFFTWVTDSNVQQIITEQWKPQVDTWLECYWVVVPENANYKGSVGYANQMLGARKLLRDFQPIHETGRKDSITGEQSVLHDEQDDVAFWHYIKNAQRNLALLSSSERLSAISVIKRFAHERNVGYEALEIKNRYPSTSSIATASFKYDIFKAILSGAGMKSANLLQTLKNFIRRLLECYHETDKRIQTKRPINPPIDLFFTTDGYFNPEYFPKISALSEVQLSEDKASEDEKYWQTQFMCIDGDYFFEDTLITKTIAEYMPDLAPDPDKNKQEYQKQYDLRIKHLKPKVALAQKALKNMLNHAAEFDILPPQPYLAILAMDGDHMGKTLSSFTDASQHKEFSSTLADFARGPVREIVEDEHLGRLVYAGGDDVLALLSVRHALDVAEKLRIKFANEVKSFKNHKGEAISASTGIVFVHHTHDLQSAIRAAKSAEAFAKNPGGRNALAVKLLPRSGEPREMSGKWQSGDEKIVAKVQALQKWFSNDVLGRNLPQDMGRIAYEMGGGTVPIDATKKEIERVIKRRIAEGTPDSVKIEIVEAIIWLVEQHTDSLQGVQHWVTLARFIAQKEGMR